MFEEDNITLTIPGAEGWDIPMSVTRSELQFIVNQAANVYGVTATRRRYCPCGMQGCSDPDPALNAAHNVGVRS